jgi:predicted transposase YbfD/YdcC
MLRSKKVGKLPVDGGDKLKQTNEIKTAAPLLHSVDIKGKTITADALLTQTNFARYLLFRGADYHFTVKGNQKHLLEDISFYFDQIRHNDVDYKTIDSGHGRITTRKIWVSTELNKHLKFPGVAQIFMVQRNTINKKSNKETQDVAYGMTSKTPERANAEDVLRDNRGHWAIENGCHYVLDWSFDEDRSRIRTGYGPENVTRLRRFAIGLIKIKKAKNVAERMRYLNNNVRQVFDYLKMSRNSCGGSFV